MSVVCDALCVRSQLIVVSVVLNMIKLCFPMNLTNKYPVSYLRTFCIFLCNFFFFFWGGGGGGVVLCFIICFHQYGTNY
jgi:hypothetical protein